jgi:hypothetical protein
MALLEERSVAKLAPGCASRIFSTHPLTNKPLGEEFNVRLYFFAKFAIGFS